MSYFKNSKVLLIFIKHCGLFRTVGPTTELHFASVGTIAYYLDAVEQVDHFVYHPRTKFVGRPDDRISGWEPTGKTFQ